MHPRLYISPLITGLFAGNVLSYRAHDMSALHKMCGDDEKTAAKMVDRLFEARLLGLGFLVHVLPTINTVTMSFGFREDLEFSLGVAGRQPRYVSEAMRQTLQERIGFSLEILGRSPFRLLLKGGFGQLSGFYFSAASLGRKTFKVSSRVEPRLGGVFA